LKFAIGREWRSNNNILTGLIVSPVSQILPAWHTEWLAVARNVEAVLTPPREK